MSNVVELKWDVNSYFASNCLVIDHACGMFYSGFHSPDKIISCFFHIIARGRKYSDISLQISRYTGEKPVL